MKFKKIIPLLLIILILCTIQAISAANLEVNDANYNDYFSSTGTINLNDGDSITFTENLENKDITIDKNLTIKSKPNIILTDSSFTFTQTSTGSTLKNTTIRGTNNLITINTASDITITNNKLESTGTSTSTIYATNTNNLKITNNEIKSIGATNPGFLYSISIQNSQNTLINANKITTNSTAYIVQYDVDDNPTYKTLSIYLTNSPQTKITNNNIITDYNNAIGEINTVVSIHAKDSTNLEIKSNNVSTNANKYGYGLSFKDNANLNVSNNKIITTSQYYANGITIVGEEVGNFEFNTINLNAETVTYGFLTGTVGGPILASNYLNNTINTKSTYSMGMEIMGSKSSNITGNKITIDANYGLGIGLLANSQKNIIDYNKINIKGTSTDTINYNDILDFENTGIVMQELTEDNENAGTNYFRNNNITTQGKYTINLKNTTNNNVRNNYLVSSTLEGDNSVHSSSSTNTIRNNTPKVETSNIIYVSNKGSDSNKGTKADPLLTLTAAISRVETEGEIIILDNIVANGLTIDKNITITGANQNVTINGGAEDLFLINSEISGVGKVIIQNLSITNCSTEGGSVILSFAPELYLNNLIIYRNREKQSSSDFYGPVSNYGNLYVNNCLFYDNSGVSGGAIYSTGNLTVTNTIFHDNYANNHGGAIAMGQSSTEATSLKIENSTFYNNFANKYGGAVYAQLSNLIVNHSIFIDNNANAGGFYYGFGNLYTSSNIQYSVIYNNPSNYGDIYTYMQNVHANYNWWGDNNGSLNRYKYGDGFPVTMDLTKPVIMTLNPNETIPDSIPTTITANLNKYSYGGQLLDLNDFIPVRNATFLSESGTFSQKTVETKNGIANSTFTGQSKGELNVTIDDQTITLNTTIITKNVTLTLNNTNFNSNEEITLIIILQDSNKNPVNNGILNATFNNEKYSTTVKDGIATIKIGKLSPKDYTIDVNYIPSDDRYNANSNTLNFKVTNSPTPSTNIKITLTEEITGYPNENILVTINVTVNELPADSGIITLTLNNKTYKNNITNGIAKLNITLPETPGSYTSTITYTNSQETSTITTITVKENTNTTTPTQLTIKFEEQENNQKITGTLTATNGDKITDNINLTLTRLSSRASKTYTIQTNKGQYELNINLAQGDYSIQATYNGNKQYLPNKTNTQLITIIGKEQNAILNDENQINKTYGEKISYNGTLTDKEGNKLIGYHVAVNITRLSSGASKVYYVTTDYNGNYNLPINLAPGEYTIHTSINDNNFTTASLTTLTINKNTTQTILQTNNTIIHYNAGESFTGKLTDNKNNILAGQHINVELTRPSSGASKVYDVVTDYTGTFRLPINLAPGIYSVISSYTGTNSYDSTSNSNTITVQ